jgi:hypothetical protein
MDGLVEDWDRNALRKIPGPQALHNCGGHKKDSRSHCRDPDGRRDISELGRGDVKRTPGASDTRVAMKPPTVQTDRVSSIATHGCW